ncbi:ABC transporter ATP-binding protein [Mycoplasma sp. 21DD0573]|uniref:ABC transporter ATP-binding protein n=1 Tax=unclassified Mycoplasma TaxID=2683645 RepID=UPI002B1E0CFD|nr:ABC transporter ATP-binding protein [Mycoplasma sp. 21DD0573]MEA4276535.1 ABC transporter ATP-binding protein [Mycoplasma sp. 21DD0573]
MQRAQTKNYVPTHFSFFELTKNYRTASLLSILFAILEVVAQVLIPLAVKKLMDNGIQKLAFAALQNEAWNGILKYSLVIIALALASLAFGALSGIFASKAAAGLGYNARAYAYKNLMRLSFKNLDNYSNGTLITRLTTDIVSIQNAYLNIIRMMLRAPIMILVAISIAFTIAPILASILLAIMVVLAIFIGFVMFMVYRRYHLMLKAYDGLNTKIGENLNAIRTIKSFVKEQDELLDIKNSSALVRKISIMTEKWINSNRALFGLLIYVCLVSFIAVATKDIVVNKQNATMDFGTLTSFIGYMFQVLVNFILFSVGVINVTSAKASAKRIRELIEEKPILVQKEDGLTEVASGKIEFRNVSLKYKEHAELNNLNNINLTIEPGETVGILGKTGAGKSSLISLIPRLYDVTNGEVLVGGVNVKDYNLEALRNQVSIVLQKNVLFTGTVAENMRWGNEEATDEEIIEALKKASAYDFVFAKDGLSTWVEESGNNFSGGQKQRLSIARSILKKSKILILDDSTSAVDNNTDKKIQHSLKYELGDVTKIIIAQRISSIQHANKIVIVNDGEISGIGKHEELLKSNEYYRHLYETQNRGSDE